MTLNPVLRVDTQMIEAIQAHRALLALRGAGARPRCAGAGRHPEPRAAAAAAYPHELSGGMRQRVAIAIAFVNKPDLVIADEPTTALDVTIQAQILHEAQELCRRTGTAMIWITHDLAVVSSLADRIAVMYAGSIVEQGSASDVIRAPLHPYTKGLLGSVPSANARGTRLDPDPRHDAVAARSCRRAAASARAARAPPPSAAPRRRSPMPIAAPRGALLAAADCGTCRHDAAAATPIIEARGLSKRFVKQADLAERLLERLGAGHAPSVVHAVDNVSLAIASGEVVGLVGEFGLRQVDARPHDRRPAASRAKARCCSRGVIGQTLAGARGQGRAAGRADDLPGPLCLAQSAHAGRDHHRRGAAACTASCRAPSSARYVDDMLKRVGLDPGFKRRYPHQFSGGQRSRIGIARALAVSPEFLVCDEAIAALDVSIQAQIINLFMDLRQAFDLTYLFISHDLGVVRHISRPHRHHVPGPDRGGVADGGAVRGAQPSLHPGPARRGAAHLATRSAQFQPIKGEIPSPLDPPRGCHFHPRCPQAMPRCAEEAPALKAIAPGRLSACHLNDN